MKTIIAGLCILLFTVPMKPIYGQESPVATPTAEDSGSKNAESTASPSDPASRDPRFAALKKMLTDVVLVGMFTVDRKKMNDLSEERYEIKSIQKLSADDDLWALEARIKYGAHDVTVPIVMSIKWADQTPVMTMDRLVIPGLGTFSARVVFHDDKYAGTWTHDNNGGHLFGRIERPKS